MTDYDDEDQEMNRLADWQAAAQGCGLLILVAWAALFAVIIAISAPSAHGQDVILPVYNVNVGEQALRLPPAGKKIWFIVNPNSGPGSSRDAAFNRFITGANAAKQRVLFYIDLVAFPGDGLTPPSAKEHVKTPQELVNERTLYSKWYGSLQFDGWFFDDVRAGMNESFLCISSWPGEKVMNPGCAWAPPASLSKAKVVISEQAKAWPRKPTAWEIANKNRCIVMGLLISQASLPAFTESTRGMAMRYASPLDDNWKNGQSAYSTLTPYLPTLLK